MREEGRLYLGIDIGSVSLNVAVVDDETNLVDCVYERTRGQPVPCLRDVFSSRLSKFKRFDGALATGSGRDLVANILGISRENEIVTQARAVSYFHPEVRTVIEIGGQDSKLIFLDPDERKGRSIITDHALNEICAAGTGSFLDQQAYRLGVSIDGEFGELALRSERPATIAGRCSVFAKSDMVHLQQEGVPKEDIIAGLCYALARNYISNLAKGKKFRKPVAFQGGVAANQGVVRAFRDLLELGPGELIIPQHFMVMGAVGSAIVARENEKKTNLEPARAAVDLEKYLEKIAGEAKHSYLKRLEYEERCTGVGELNPERNGHKQRVFLGIDVGAASTKVVILDEEKNLLRKEYLWTEGEPIQSVRRGLAKAIQGLEGDLEVLSAGVTGSGRYFVGDFLGADVITNEITAQAKATIEMDNSVDTIFEIGGQDSKYISIKNGSVVDFEMNKVCAAGTGSFLQEQAVRLDVEIENFSRHALSSRSPADLGTRCTVFMESDLIHHQQVGLPKEDLIAGLSYSVAYNFIEKVVGNKRIGQRIYFQGGVAANRSVAAAFENILGRNISIPENYSVTGAVGAALIAREKWNQDPKATNFAGFDLKHRSYQVKSFECKHCPNHCEIKRISIGGQPESFHGGICDRYEISRKGADDQEVPDLFQEREKLLLSYFREDRIAGAPSIGMPRMLMFYEQFPLWATFFQGLGLNVVLSEKTNRRLINKGLALLLAEMCYPVKVAYGHVEDLVEKKVDYVFLPNVIDLEKMADDADRSYNCPYIQGSPFMLGPAFEDRAKILSPTIYLAEENYNLERELVRLGRMFGKSTAECSRAANSAVKAQAEFRQKCLERGRSILQGLQRRNEAVVVIGKPYNVHDIGLNLNIPKKLRKLGVLAIPYDLLPLDTVRLASHYSNLVWKNEQNLLRAAIFARDHPSLNPVLITNYGCGPDAFFMKYLEDTMGENPCLVVEVDEHSADAGIGTRIEAFVDTVSMPRVISGKTEEVDLNVMRPNGGLTILKPSRLIRELDRTIYIPYLSAHSDVLSAALQTAGLDSRVLPRPDERSDELGRRYASSKECHPYSLLTGDLVRMTELDGFDPDRSAFFTLNFDGSCRMSQYPLSFKLVLKRLGLAHMPVIAPSTSVRLDEATRLFGLDWARAIWKGWLATDVLISKLLHIRPYEVNKGETERAYDSAIELIISALLEGDFPGKLARAGKMMDSIPIKGEDKPIIGIVGEFYTCMNSWANDEIVKDLESLGTEVKFGPTTTDYLVYFEHAYPGVNLSKGKYLTALYYFLRRSWDVHWQKRIESLLGADLSDWKLPSINDRIEMASPYVSPAIDPVVTVNLSKAEYYARKKCAGIANLIVLNCVFGTLATAIYKKVQKRHNNIPLLTIIYDGLKQTNTKTRIEAFVHQAKSYHEKYCLTP